MNNSSVDCLNTFVKTLEKYNEQVSNYFINRNTSGWVEGINNIYVDDRTIDSHIKRLRKKFKSYDASFNQIRTRYGSGYSWRE